jgi:Zn finger protein HypA/HybF involved in hydrogenase expression
MKVILKIKCPKDDADGTYWEEDEIEITNYGSPFPVTSCNCEIISAKVPIICNKCGNLRYFY